LLLFVPEFGDHIGLRFVDTRAVAVVPGWASEHTGREAHADHRDVDVVKAEPAGGAADVTRVRSGPACCNG
jgi:hypothetical protein